MIDYHELPIERLQSDAITEMQSRFDSYDVNIKAITFNIENNIVPHLESSVNELNIILSTEGKQAALKQIKVYLDALYVPINKVIIGTRNEFINKGPKSIISSNYRERQTFFLDFAEYLLWNKYYMTICVMINGNEEGVTDDSTHEGSFRSLDERHKRTRGAIERLFYELKDGWKYAFVTQKDFDQYVDVLTNYFVDGNSIPPKSQSTISMKRRTKTKISDVLREIHNELGQHDLKDDKDFHSIVRLLNHFKGLNTSELINTIQK